ncbi:hypothetical protein MF271_13720 [Deinococcus sp. KNUC1210]|uniref:tachylectin-related carbohydrate-binding protein n=1 Tax=Deinococcus sp. KNUC1210 TaxID=2917691 RepID=UPI001EF06502|nr:tachylectin-related carbohydrate-binding protein [Deinococcus sp. KNUC1210]ULH15009.1 hypothetical protein MF271_13720 [Deinococcus sp. KNUC1210]
MFSRLTVSTLLALSALAPVAQAQSAPRPAIIYGILPGGDLNWYRHNANLTGGGLQDAGSWNASSGKTVGIGWNGMKEVFPGDNGVIYAITPNGDLKWYKHTANLTGGGLQDAGSWNASSGKTVGIGWNEFVKVFSGGNGVIYGILPNGDLKWYRHTAYLTGGGLQDAGSWNPTSGKTVGIGWNGFKDVFSGGNGIIYGILPNGDLKWYRHAAYLTGGGLQDAGSWNPTSGKTVGVGWNGFNQVFSTGKGIMYGILPNGDLKWYRHTAYLTGGGLQDAGSWNPTSGKTVGVGWNSFLTVFGF